MYDPKTIVSGSDDKTVVASKIHSNNKRIFRGHLDSVSCVLKLMDSRVVSGSRDNNLIIWPEHYFDFTPPPPPLPEPTFNKNGESLDQLGNVLPNCAICWEIINGNRPEINKILACGGIFHKKCIRVMTHCPICEKIII
jgi:WD40 repeat protein